MKTISLIIPAFNEEKTLAKTLEIASNLNFPNLKKEIICIDDGSSDKTPQIMKKYKAKTDLEFITNKKNIGKSQSVKKGILASIGDIVVVLDADMETNPADIIPMSQLMLEKKYDVIFANRYDKKINNKVSIKNYLGNKFLTTLSNLFTVWRGLVVPDMEVCHKMIRGNVFRDIVSNLESTSTIGLEPEITAKVAKYRIRGKKLKFGVYPIKYFPRSKEEGKKVKYINDGLKAFMEIIKYNLFN